MFCSATETPVNQSVQMERFPPNVFVPLMQTKSGHIGTGTPQKCHVGSKYFYPLIHGGLRCQI